MAKWGLTIAGNQFRVRTACFSQVGVGRVFFIFTTGGLVGLPQNHLPNLTHKVPIIGGQKDVNDETESCRR